MGNRRRTPLAIAVSPEAKSAFDTLRNEFGLTQTRLVAALCKGWRLLTAEQQRDLIVATASESPAKE